VGPFLDGTGGGLAALIELDARRFAASLEGGDLGFHRRRRRAQRLDLLLVERDLLLQAAALGMTVREEPIRFTYRVAGRSKLPFVRTSGEYLALLAATAWGATRRGRRRLGRPSEAD